jgi:hypothetical protein
MAVAVRKGYFFDVPFIHGRPETVARESLVTGTALSAPVFMLVFQAVATATLARSPKLNAVRMIGVIGAIDVPGYLCERHVRRRLRPSGWDRLESPLIVGSILLAGAMTVLARSVADGFSADQV